MQINIFDVHKLHITKKSRRNDSDSSWMTIEATDAKGVTHVINLHADTFKQNPAIDGAAIVDIN